MISRRLLPILLGIAFAINAASWILVYVSVPVSHGPFIIRYQWGSTGDLFGSRTALYAMSAIGLIIFIINAMITQTVSRQNRSYAIGIAAMTVVYQVVVLLYARMLVQVNVF